MKELRNINSTHRNLKVEIDEKKALDDELEDKMRMAITEFSKDSTYVRGGMLAALIDIKADDRY